VQGGAGGFSGGNFGGEGAGGAGIVGQNLTIIMGAAGSVAGAPGANAISFAAGANTLTFSKATTGLTGNIGVSGSLTFDQSGIDTTVDNVITGSGSVVKTGTHAITLSGVNTYTGGTAINGGVLSVAADANLGASTGGLAFGGGTLRLGASFGLASTRAIALNAGGGTFDTNGFDTTVSQAIAGPGGLTKAGAGTLTLAGINTYAGGTTINGGVLSVAADANLGANTGALGFGGGTLRLGADFNLASTRAIALNAGGGTFDTNGFTTTVSQAITGPGGLTKAGAGTLILSGASTYTGGTTIGDGALQLGDGGTTGAILGAVAVGVLGRFNLINADTSGITSISNAGQTNFHNSISAGSATITNDPGGVFLFHNASTAGNATIINNSYVTFFDSSRAGSAAITNNNSVIFSDASTAGGATITNNATLQFDGTSTAGSAAITNDGHLDFYADSKAGNATITNNAHLAFIDGSTAGGATITNNATLLFYGSSRGGTARFITTSGGQVDISALTTAGMTAGSIEGAGSYFLGSKELSVGGNNLSTEVSGVIADGGGLGGTGGSLVKTGTGTLILSGANTYTGGTTLAGGTLRLANNQALGTGTLTTTGSVVDYAASVTIGNTIVIDSNSTQLQVTAGSATQAGIISELNGPRPLEKIGAGTLVLTATSSYSGATTVSAGTLVVDGDITSSSGVTVNAGARLAGIGTVGATIINSGGMFAPGSGMPGSSMTVAGNLAFQSGALYLVQVDPSNASRANVTAGGSATLAGTAVAAFAPGNYLTRSYTILSATGGLGGSTFDALATSNLPVGFRATLDYTASDVILNLTATLATAGLSGNQRNVSGTLNNFFNGGGALPPAFLPVFGLTGGNLGNALSQLSGEAATGAQQSAFQLGGQFLNLMLDPFVDGRGGSGGPAIGFATERGHLPEEIARAYARAMKAPVTEPPPGFAQRWAATIFPRAPPVLPPASTIA
jgi:autotransporter-associated beta strand protein